MGDALMNVALRAGVIFLVLWLVIRVSGKREISQLSAFELILLVTLSDLVAQGVLGEDTSLTGAVIAVVTFALLSVLLSWITWRFPTSRRALAGADAA